MDGLIFVIIIVFAVILYYATKKQKRQQTKTQNYQAVVDSLDVSYEYDDRDSVRHQIAYILNNIYILLNDKSSGPYYSPPLESITRQVLELQDFIGSEHIRKSLRYKAIISEYNSIAESQKQREAQLINDSLALVTLGDMRHCPSCGEDVGKEVTRVRGCPKCHEKIIIYRRIPDKRILINTEQEEKLTALRASFGSVQLPNVLDAFTLSPETQAKLDAFIQQYKESEEIRAKASNLTIDLD